jgi:hypothetical protein
VQLIAEHQDIPRVEVAVQADLADIPGPAKTGFDAIYYEFGNALVGGTQLVRDKSLFEQKISRFQRVAVHVDARAVFEICGFANEVNTRHKPAELFQ